MEKICSYYSQVENAIFVIHLACKYIYLYICIYVYVAFKQIHSKHCTRDKVNKIMHANLSSSALNSNFHTCPTIYEEEEEEEEKKRRRRRRRRRKTF